MKTSIALFFVLFFSVACSNPPRPEKEIKKVSAGTTKINETPPTEIEIIKKNIFSFLKSRKERFAVKIKAAAVYFKTFGIRIWTKTRNFTTNQAREVSTLGAINELTQIIGEIHKKINIKKMSPTAKGRRHRDEQAFYAVSVTMHMNQHYKEELIDTKASLKANSFYDVLKDALKKDYNSEVLNEYEETLVSISNREMMIDLIKARIDMFSALALDNLTDENEMNLSQNVDAALFKISDGKYGEIEIPENFNNVDEATKIQTLGYLEAALEAKDFLHSIGIEKQLEKKLKSAYSNIELENDEQLTETAQEKEEIKKLINELLE